MRIRPILAVTLTCLLAWAGVIAWRVAERADDVVPAGQSQQLPAQPDKHVALSVPWPATGQAALQVLGRGSDGSHGDQRPVPIASLAKMMTAYLLLQHEPLADGARGFTITMGAHEVADYGRRVLRDESVVPVQEGEVLDQRQLLEALLLPSANNIAIVLAIHDAGSVPDFVARMNDAAAELGMTQTTYTDPSGFDSGTVSTAKDQLILVQAALGDRTFAEIVRMHSADLPVVGTVRNTNPLLDEPGFFGVKTGSDDDARGCLAFAVTRTVRGQPVTVLGVVLGQGSRGRSLTAAAGDAARAMVDAVYTDLGGAASTVPETAVAGS